MIAGLTAREGKAGLGRLHTTLVQMGSELVGVPGPHRPRNVAPESKHTETIGPRAQVQYHTPSSALPQPPLAAPRAKSQYPETYHARHATWEMGSLPIASRLWLGAQERLTAGRLHLIQEVCSKC